MSSLNLIANMALTAYYSIRELFKTRREAFYKKRAKKAIEKRLKELQSENGSKPDILELHD